MDYKALKEMDLSRDEVERLGAALRDDRFKRLFADYVEELRDPENIKTYQKEMTQLEKERGFDVKFLNPEPGYVVKTSVDGEKKCFVNVCANAEVGKPSSSVGVREGAKGLRWTLPHSLSPAREDVDRKGVRCDVYDVLFHPDTLHLAENNKAFRAMLTTTACEAVESNFSVTLDKKNLKFPKMQYKGSPYATVIRKPSQDKPVERDPEDQALFEKIYANVSEKDATQAKKSRVKKTKQDQVHANYTTPNFVVKHRSHVDIQEFTENRDAKMNVAIPKELVLEVDLPLLKASSDIILDVTEKMVHLLSEKPAKYKLEVALPYQVNQDGGNAKFDKDKKKLIVTLPVKRKDYFIEDSGVESDPGSSMSSSPSEEIAAISEISEVREPSAEFRTSVKGFLEESLEYNLPDFVCHVFENNIAFTLNVKNVSEGSVEKTFSADSKAVHVKFSSISSSFFPAHYAFYVKLPEHSIDTEHVSLEAWDNNVVLQFPFQPSDKLVTNYFVGLRESDAFEKYVEEPHILNSILQNNFEESEKQPDIKQEQTQIPPSSPNNLKSETEEPETEKHLEEREKQPQADPEEHNLPSRSEKKESKAIDITGTYSESSGDELSCSYSPSKGRGILKRLGRRNVSRSVSESSLDDMICASSFENCHTSLDSVIPEDGEVSTSLKKTVRFNDHVLKQLYRSNSSILGQKKKNQRKKTNKKRAQERRCSESEASEAEDKKEREEEEDTRERDGEKTNTVEEVVEKKEEDFSADVFQLDMYF